MNCDPGVVKPLSPVTVLLRRHADWPGHRGELQLPFQLQDSHVEIGGEVAGVELGVDVSAGDGEGGGVGGGGVGADAPPEKKPNLLLLVDTKSKIIPFRSGPFLM